MILRNKRDAEQWIRERSIDSMKQNSYLKVNDVINVAEDNRFYQIVIEETSIALNNGLYAKSITKEIKQEFDSSAIVSGTLDKERIPQLDASYISSGVLNVDRIPKAALNKCVIVQNDTERFKLTKEQVHNGDSVKVIDPDDIMYVVIDDDRLDVEKGYTKYSSTVRWENVEDVPFATKLNAGVVQIGDGISVNETGTANLDLDYVNERYYTENEIDDFNLDINNKVDDLSTTLKNDLDSFKVETNKTLEETRSELEVQIENKTLNSTNEGITIDGQDVTLNTTNNLTDGGIDKPLSAEQGKVLKRLIDTIEVGQSFPLENSYNMTKIEYSGILTANGSDVQTEHRLYNPTLFIDGIRIDSSAYNLNLAQGTFTLQESYANYETTWVVTDVLPNHIKFSYPTLEALKTDTPTKNIINLGDVIEILGVNKPDDGYRKLYKCVEEETDFQLGTHRYLKEIPYKYLEDAIKKANKYIADKEKNLTNQINTKLDKTGGTVTGNLIVPNVKINNYLKIKDWYGSSELNMWYNNASSGYTKNCLYIPATIKSNNKTVLTTDDKSSLENRINSSWNNSNNHISKSANGYCKLSNGLIIQWFTKYTSSGTVVNFPISFTTMNYSIAVLGTNYDGDRTNGFSITNRSESSVTIRIRHKDSVAYYIAIGY